MKQLEVVAALFEADGKFLICQRAEGKARALHWEFPGGKVEPGETHAQAIERECMEELDVQVLAGEAVMDVTHAYPDLTVHLTLMRVQVICGAPRCLEHREIRYIAPQEAAQYDFCPADRAFVRALGGKTKDE